MRTLSTFFILFLMSSSAHALFGLLGRDQCNYQQTSYPTYNNDARQAVTVQLQGLQTQKQQMEARLALLSQESLRLQAGIRGYIHTPWSETMLAHVDNGLDCCAPTSTYADSSLQNSERRPAGQDLPQTDSEVKPVDPTPENPPYVAPAPPYTPPKVTNSCQGYPAQYCTGNWGQPYSSPRPGGGLCLQTGFAATPAWYQAACRNGGKIDPQVCANPQIAKSPAQYQMCISMLDSYEKVAVERRQLGAHINEINNGMNAIRYSANGQPAPGTDAGSEAKSGVLSGIGNFLGTVVSTLGPFMLNQYMSYQQQKNMKYSSHYTPGSPMAKYGPPRRVTNVDGSTSTGNLNRPYYTTPQPPPPYYGPRYGFPYTYGGNYGAMLPGYQAGGFGCTPGTANNGMSLIGTLLGGALGLNANTSLQASFGPNGGYVPYQAYLNAYGNLHSGVPPHTFPGYTPPYQPGGIYGTTPTYRPPYVSPFGYQSVPNYYTNPNTGYRPPTSLPPYTPPYAQTRPLYQQAPQTNTYGWDYSSYFYAQAMNNQQMLAANDARLRERQLQINYQLAQIQNINSSFSRYNYTPGVQSQYTGYGYQSPSLLTTTPGIGGILQSLLSGNSAYFNVNMQGF